MNGSAQMLPHSGTNYVLLVVIIVVVLLIVLTTASLVARTRRRDRRIAELERRLPHGNDR